MTLLRLGVLDVPYSHPNTSPSKTRTSEEPTTGDVAGWLEDRYHVMEHFFQAHGREIADDLTQALQDFYEDRISGSPANAVSFTAAESRIRERFNKFLDNREMDSLGYPGIPTQAALDGVNHRFKHPYAKGNPERPSFIDTGLYENSFRAEVEE